MGCGCVGRNRDRFRILPILVSRFHEVTVSRHRGSKSCVVGQRKGELRPANHQPFGYGHGADCQRAFGALQGNISKITFAIPDEQIGLERFSFGMRYRQLMPADTYLLSGGKRVAIELGGCFREEWLTRHGRGELHICLCVQPLMQTYAIKH